MNDEHEKSRMKEATNELACLISSLNLESEDMLIKENVRLEERKLLMQSTTWFSWRIWHGVENPCGFRFEMKS